MEYRQLGRTGMRVSLLGLGTGGANVFGQARGAGLAEARTLVQRALDLGVNLFDTAQAYRESEVLLGEALAGVPRSDYVLATKYSYRGRDGALLADGEVDALIRRSLDRLRTDVLDVMQIHGLKPADYDEVVERHLPVLERAQAAGARARDRRDRVVRRRRSRPRDAAPRARRRMARDADGRLQRAQPERGARGVSACRGWRRGRVHHGRGAPRAEVTARPGGTGRGAEGSWARGGDAVPDADPLGWLVSGGASSVQAACYRFAAEPAAVSSVLTGTFDPDHLAENAAALAAGAASAAELARLGRRSATWSLGLGR